MSVLRFRPNHTPLKYKCLFETSNRIRHAYFILHAGVGEKPRGIPRQQPEKLYRCSDLALCGGFFINHLFTCRVVRF